MKGPRSLSQFLTIALAVAPLTSAWSNFLPDIDALVVRQEDATTTERPAETATSDSEKTTDPPEATATGDATTTDEKATTSGPRTGNLNTGGLTQSQTGSGSGAATQSSTGRPTFNATDGAGSVVMQTPALTAGSQLYKIENPTPITWVWNYTQLQAEPTAIDVLVSCSVATATWTLTQNMTFETQPTFTWDTWEYQRSHVDQKLLTEQYTLIIYDADSDPTSTAEAGYLAPFDGFRFGLYATQAYHNLSEWECVTCSAGNGDLDRKALGFAVSMSLITIFSFTWYVVGFAGLL